MGAFTYPRSEPGSSGHMDLVEALNATTLKLRDAVGDLPEDVLTYHPSENEWSIKQIVAHLLLDAEVSHDRLWRMINLEEPRLKPYVPETAGEVQEADKAPIQDLLDRFAAVRAKTVDMLAELVHWNWARCGRHEELGRMSIRQLVDRKIAHEAAHLEEIERLKEAARG